MRGADLARFAGKGEANTDDWPVLEFHGQRDLNLQTDKGNVEQLVAFPQTVEPPQEVRDLRAGMTIEQMLARAQMFEKAESYRLAFDSYQRALVKRTGDVAAMAGMLRNARTDADRAVAGTLETRTREALEEANRGNLAAAESLLVAVIRAWPERPEGYLNYGVFCLQRSHYDDAIESFNGAIRADARYLPAFEAMAETYLRKRDLRNAAMWSRRILEIDPGHSTAKQALAAIEQQASELPTTH
jgi:tetratricopeptide (TPR) repeat protein